MGKGDDGQKKQLVCSDKKLDLDNWSPRHRKSFKDLERFFFQMGLLKGKLGLNNRLIGVSLRVFKQFIYGNILNFPRICF